MKSKETRLTLRRIKQLFTSAYQKRPSIIFIDEIDFLCSKRNETENETSRRMKTEFLIQMQNFKEHEIVILGATNRPFEIDSAVIRRFERRIYVPLPDSDSRIKILQMNCQQTEHDLKEIDWKEISDKTEGYSGSDLVGFVKNVVMEPIRMIMSSKYFKRVNEMFEISNQDDQEAILLEYTKIPFNKIKIPIVTKEIFLKILLNTKSSICQDEIEKFSEFTKMYSA